MLSTDKDTFKASIVETLRLNEPIQLLEPQFGAPIAVINLVKIGKRLNEELYKFNYMPLIKKLLKSLCPNYVANLNQVTKELRQVYADKTSTVIKTPIHDFINHLHKVLRPVVTQDPAPCNYACELISSL